VTVKQWKAQFNDEFWAKLAAVPDHWTVERGLVGNLCLCDESGEVRAAIEVRTLDLFVYESAEEGNKPQ
jgi:hypothetical protein